MKTIGPYKSRPDLVLNDSLNDCVGSWNFGKCTNSTETIVQMWGINKVRLKPTNKPARQENLD